MAQIDIGNLFSSMFAAAKDATGDDWQSLVDHAEGELRRLAELAARIEAQHLVGDLTDEEATALLEGARIAARIALRSAAGVQRVIAEKAINAAVGVLRETLNSAVGFSLL